MNTINYILLLILGLKILMCTLRLPLINNDWQQLENYRLDKRSLREDIKFIKQFKWTTKNNMFGE